MNTELLQALGHAAAPGAALGAAAGGIHGAASAEDGDALMGALRGAAAGGVGGGLLAIPGGVLGAGLGMGRNALRGVKTPHGDAPQGDQLLQVMQDVGRGIGTGYGAGGVGGGLAGSMLANAGKGGEESSKVAMNAFEAGQYDALAKLGFAPAVMAAGRAAIGAAKPALGMAGRAFSLGGRQAMKGFGAAGRAGMSTLQQQAPGLAKGLQTAGKVLKHPATQVGMMGASML